MNYRIKAKLFMYEETRDKLNSKNRELQVKTDKTKKEKKEIENLSCAIKNINEIINMLKK